MTDTVVIAGDGEHGSGYRFSWGLAFAGGVAATAVTFFLLTLGSGFGLLLVNPVTHSGPTLSTFLTGGAIYFMAAQTFGFAIGGHLAGRMLGPVLESPVQEEFRAAAHGFVAWAVTVLATLTMVTLAGLVAAGAGAATAALYGAASTHNDPVGPTAYLVDKLFRPATPSGIEGSDMRAVGARVEAGRLLEAGLMRGEKLAPDDRARLIALTSQQSGTARDVAAGRVDHMQADVQKKTRQAADIARKTASYTSLWIAASLLFGALVSIVTAIFARKEDDGDGLFFRLH
jgi:hypothetical protein